MLSRLVIMIMKYQLKNMRKKQDTPYICIKGTGKDYPDYLMFTDDETIRAKMHAIN